MLTGLKFAVARGHSRIDQLLERLIPGSHVTVATEVRHKV